MYQGMHPRTRLLRWTLYLAIVVLIIAASGGAAIDAVSNWLANEHDKLDWYLTRATALLAYLALTAAVIYGLLLSTKLLDRIAHRAVSFTLHQDLSAIGLALALVHAALLMLDRTAPYSPAELVIPFTGPYRPLWVGIGQIAMALTIVVLGSFYVRKGIGQKRWRQVHYLAFAAWAAATVHGVMAGTDSQADPMRLGYVVSAAIVTFLLAYRVVLAVAARRAVSARPTV
jgi:DMSO/TMAO reductase YedYZ heme-binding membrane subunit